MTRRKHGKASVRRYSSTKRYGNLTEGKQSPRHIFAARPQHEGRHFVGNPY
jgi:ribosomal protein L35